MARFDVYEIKQAGFRYVVDVQADLLADLTTRVVVPLLPASMLMLNLRDLNPPVSIGVESLVFFPQLIMTISKSILRRHVVQLVAERDDMTRALDMLLSGF